MPDMITKDCIAIVEMNVQVSYSKDFPMSRREVEEAVRGEIRDKTHLYLSELGHWEIIIPDGEKENDYA